MNEMINNLGGRIVTLLRVINIDRREWSQDERRFTESRPCTRFDHELRGMTMAMKAMGIEFEFDFDENVIEYTAISIMGRRFDVNKEA